MIFSLVKSYAGMNFTLLVSGRHHDELHRRWAQGYVYSTSQVKIFTSGGDTLYSGTGFFYVALGYVS